MTEEFRLALETKDVREKIKMWLFIMGSLSSQIPIIKKTGNVRIT